MFTEKELSIIKTAKLKAKKVKIIRMMSLVTITVGMVLMMLGYLAPEYFAYLAVLLTVIVIASPQLGGEPTYETLLDLLMSKCETK